MINVFYASELTELLQNSHEELNQVSEDWSAQEEKRTANQKPIRDGRVTQADHPLRGDAVWQLPGWQHSSVHSIL